MKFLVIRFSSIGDIVLTTPVVRCLKKQVVTAEVHYATKSAFRSIIEWNPYIDKVHYLDNGLDKLVDELKREDFDYVIDLHHNLRTAKVKRALGKKSFSFRKLNIEKWLLTALKINVLPDLHLVDRYMDTVKSFGVKNDGAGLDYFIPEEDKVKENDIPASHHAGYIGIVIGAAHNTKKLPLHKLQEMCRDIDHPVILLGGKEDSANGEAIASVDTAKVYNACGKFRINESADLVRRAKLIITHDTGLMHIATAFNRPVISIWGNTAPEFGMYPYYGDNYLRNYYGQAAQSNSAESAEASNHRQTPPEAGTVRRGMPYDIMEIKKLYCRPCSKIGYRKCPLGHFKCMEKQSIPDIIKRAYERLGN